MGTSINYRLAVWVQRLWGVASAARLGLAAPAGQTAGQQPSLVPRWPASHPSSASLPSPLLSPNLNPPQEAKPAAHRSSSKEKGAPRPALPVGARTSARR